MKRTTKVSILVTILLGTAAVLYLLLVGKSPVFDRQKVFVPAVKESGEKIGKLLGSAEPDGPPKIKNIGVKLDYFDPAAQKAGDFWFTAKKQQFDRIFMDYGFFIPAGKDDPEKYNPQPTFLVPLGTEVVSMIDGVVHDVPKLYSGDYSVMVTAKEGSQWIVELEHVKNPLVKKGDRVSAGQVVAEVSDFWEKYSGLGMVEIGILKGGNPPQHVCPFQYLDDSVKGDILGKIKAFYAAWEKHAGDDNLYDQDSYDVPGCLTQDPIEG